MSQSKVAIAGWFTVAPNMRDQVVAAHKELMQQARATEGCIDLAITADPLDPARINNFELWESEEALDHWRSIAKPPKELTPMRDVEVLKYIISSTRPPF